LVMPDDWWIWLGVGMVTAKLLIVLMHRRNH